MGFEKIAPPTMREMFVQQLVEKIFSGELRGGQKLPSERELAEKMSISRSVAHLGLEDLRRMGFVRIEPRRGIYVTDYAHEGNFETLNALSKYGGELDQALTASLVELRNAVYGGALIRLGDRHTPDDIAAMRAQINALRDSRDSGTVRDYAVQMSRFETLVTELCGNMLFPLMLNSFSDNCLKIWEKCVSFWGVDAVVAQEEHITDLVESGDGHSASAYVETIYRQYLDAHSFKAP